jgi:hypothetical protein
VVNARTAPREEARNGSVVPCRRDELDPSVADQHRRGLDALLTQRLAMLETRVEELLVGCDRLVEIGHGHAEMVDPAHAGDSTREMVDTTRSPTPGRELAAPGRGGRAVPIPGVSVPVSRHEAHARRTFWGLA